MGNIYSMNILGKEMIHFPGGIAWDCMRYHYATRNGILFRTNELCFSGFLYFIVLDDNWPHVTEKVKLGIRRDDCTSLCF